MRLPDFIIIGAAKSGTTSLYHALARHPDVFMSEPKEPEFFARDDLYAGGIEGYAALFGAAGPDQICGEASTLYTLAPLFPDAAPRIARHVPEAKLVYVLREPASRAYSYYLQQVKNYQNATRDYAVHRSFEACLEPGAHPGRAPRERFLAPFKPHLPDVPDLFLAGSDYLQQIRLYLRHFGRDRMHFLTFESLRADPAGELRALCAFLGLDPSRSPGDLPRTNISSDHFETAATVRATDAAKGWLGPLYAPLKHLPEGAKHRLKALAKRAGIGGGSAVDPPPMAPGTRAALRDRFAPDRAAIAEITGLDLAVWDTGRVSGP
jgi:hypothetical protein